MAQTAIAKKKSAEAMWLYPKVLGFNPSQRWGHSACFSTGFMYVFGGCCGGMHFSDVLCLDLDKMGWTRLATTGENPGPRDSHSAVLVGHKMIVFGGTNGFKKVNDTHILDLATRVWARPTCLGTPPSPRESHTATLVGGERLVIFGGSGEGEANYLSDLHVLDLRTMRWSSPAPRGDLPVPRDSHTALAVGNKIVVYGGDCGDQYHGDVSMLDIETMTWFQLKTQGSSPGVRAGHAAVNIGAKMYIIGGVGDKRYYNDIWVFDIFACSWTRLDTRGQQPQGRFSHTAVAADTDIAIYGGRCGEDERPLNELLVLQLGAEHPNGRYNISMCKVFGTYWNQEKRTIAEGSDNNLKTSPAAKIRWAYEPYQFDSGTSQQKRRRTAAAKVWDVESEQEEHSLSLSQHSSPSQSDQEQTPGRKANASVTDSQRYHLFKLINKIPSNCQHDNGSCNKRDSNSIARRSLQDLRLLEQQPKQEHFAHVHVGAEQNRHIQQHPIGAEVRGKVDGVFDSGLLMTATVNGRIFRGVLFAPEAGVLSSSVESNSSFPSSQTFMNSNSSQIARPIPITRGTTTNQGLVLTLGGPAASSGNHAGS